MITLEMVAEGDAEDAKEESSNGNSGKDSVAARTRDKDNGN
jgi:hypothetical protein